MQIESISIMYLGIGFLFVVFVCVALETIFEQTTNLFVGKKKDTINRLRVEVDALKIEVNALKTKLEVTTYPTKITEHASLVSPSTSQVVLDNAWSQGNGESRSIQADTWSRDERVGDASVDTWTRDKRQSDFSLVPAVSPSADEDTWVRDDSTSDSVDRGEATNLLTKAFSQEEHRTQVARYNASATVVTDAPLIRKKSRASTTRHAQSNDQPIVFPYKKRR